MSKGTRTIGRAACVAIIAGTMLSGMAPAQPAMQERWTYAGDQPTDPGPLATNLSADLKRSSVRAAMKKVADWQLARVDGHPSQDWTFATLYAGFLAASDTLRDPRYRNHVQSVGQHFNWTLGPRKTHADDQAIGQSYLALAAQDHDANKIAALKQQFDEVMEIPDDPAKPVWWWCDALFMAPPVWSGLANAKNDGKYRDYMDREWHRTYALLWNREDHLYARDASYLDKHEKNGQNLYWSRGNGWVMGGLVKVMERLPKNDTRRSFYLEQFQLMAAKVKELQGQDGLWRAGLLDAADYALPENSGSAFFVYALAWGINNHVLNAREYRPVVKKAWAGLLSHVYADGRLGCIQPVGAAPGDFIASSSYVFGVGAFLMAGSELDKLH